MQFRSPLSGNPWPDQRFGLSVLAAFMVHIDEMRPRRRPPPELSQAVHDVLDAVTTVCGVRHLSRFRSTGMTLSQAYDKARAARQVVQPFVDDGSFLQHVSSWAWWSRQTLERGIDAAARDVPLQTRLARLAYWTARAVEQCVANQAGPLLYSSTADAFEGALVEMELIGAPRALLLQLERSGAFVAASGRLPRSPEDDELLDAFEAAMMADEVDFARALVREDGAGWRDDNESE